MADTQERIVAAQNFIDYYNSLSPEEKRKADESTTQSRLLRRHRKVLRQGKKPQTPKLTPTPLVTPTRTPRLTPTPVPKSVLVSPKKTSPKKKKPNKFDEYIASIKEKPRIVLPQKKKKKKKKNHPFIPKKSYYGHR